MSPIDCFRCILTFFICFSPPCNASLLTLIISFPLLLTASLQVCLPSHYLKSLGVESTKTLCPTHFHYSLTLITRSWWCFDAFYGCYWTTANDWLLDVVMINSLLSHKASHVHYFFTFVYYLINVFPLTQPPIIDLKLKCSIAHIFTLFLPYLYLYKYNEQDIDIRQYWKTYLP